MCQEGMDHEQMKKPLVILFPPTFPSTSRFPQSMVDRSRLSRYILLLLSSKHQVTIPMKIREVLGAEPGDQVAFVYLN
ncbi:hypothetical protein A3Q36_15730 [Geobacillus stearothermophilus]|nr:hypothetical protein A3Q36_15730 [Geobacillus stearothermophilus]